MLTVKWKGIKKDQDPFFDSDLFDGAVPLTCMQYQDDSLSCFPTAFSDEEANYFKVPCIYKPITEEFRCQFIEDGVK